LLPADAAVALAPSVAGDLERFLAIRRAFPSTRRSRGCDAPMPRRQTMAEDKHFLS
jgi:hypothetical protein